MKHIITLLLAALCLILTGQSIAQVEVRLDPVRREFLLGEPPALKLTLINHTDKAISFSNTPGRNWLNFTITRSGEAYPISPNALPRFPKLTLNPGSRITRQINLSEFYSFNRDGAYKAVATVRMPDMQTTYSSNRSAFTLAHGGTIKTFTIQSRGKRLKLAVKLLRVDGKDCLFGQSVNADSNTVLGACYMGTYLNFMQPRIMLDGAQNLHVLCQSTPEYFTYSTMSPAGTRRSYKVMKRSGGPVDLVSTGSGIRTVGLTPYVKPTPESEGIIHSTTDRPN